MTHFIVFMFALFTINAAHAEDIICDAGSYLNGTECVACPDGYPNSDAGATSKTECYSNTKIRDCSTLCALPHGCQAGFCGNATCDYVAYAGGTAWKPEGAVKSGCTSCNDVAPISVKAIPGYRVNGLSCEICPAGTYSAGGDVTTCEQCPNGATTFAGATSRDECMRILNYLPTGQTTPAKIYMSMKQNTHPAFAAKIGDDTFYANMTPVESSSEPGLYVAYSNQSYIVQDNKIGFETVPFYVMTTDNVTSFSFSMTAMGDFTVDWGDGAVEKIIRDNTTRTQYSHTYDVAGAYKIVFDGRATGYSNQCSSVWLTHSAIGFYGNTSVAKIGGTLSKMFPTIDGVNPGFPRMFAGCSNLTGQIPLGLFADFTGAPHSCMFQYTFNNTPNLTGPTARTANGTRLYDIEYNGEKWIDAYPSAFTDMYTGSGIDTNN